MTVTPRILEPQCEWASADVADESVWTEVLTDAELAELDASLRHALATSDDVLEIERERLPAAHAAAAPRAHRGRTDQRPWLRAAARHRPQRLLAERDGVAVLGHRHAPGHAVAAEQVRPRAGRRHRSAQGGRRPDGARQRDRWRGAAVPLRRQRPGRPDVSGERHQRRPVGRGELGAHPQPPGAPSGPSWRPRCTTSCPTTSAASSPRTASRTTRCRCSPSGRTGCSCAASRRTSSRRSATPRRRASRPCNARRWPRWCRWPTIRRHHVLMELRPGDMQFINNYHVLHGRTAYADDRAGAGRVRHLKRLWLETTVLARRPPHFANRSHWSADAHRQPHEGELSRPTPRMPAKPSPAQGGVRARASELCRSLVPGRRAFTIEAHAEQHDQAGECPGGAADAGAEQLQVRTRRPRWSSAPPLATASSSWSGRPGRAMVVEVVVTTGATSMISTSTLRRSSGSVHAGPIPGTRAGRACR